MAKEDKNPFTDLVKYLEDGTLGHNHIQMAYREWIRRRDDIPDAIKDILSGHSRNGVVQPSGGLLLHMFRSISQSIGALELAWRRGYQAGCEETIEKQKKKK